MIAVALLVIGIYRAVAAVRHKPIADVSEPDHQPSRLRTRVTERFPALARQLNPQADLPVRQRITRAAMAGFAVCGCTRRSSRSPSPPGINCWRSATAPNEPWALWCSP